jgi:lipase maturation factor 1
MVTAIQDRQVAKESSYVVMRWLYLRLLGLIHLSAFGSYAFQIIGENGSRGVQPTQELLTVIYQNYGWQGYWLCPTISWFNCSDLSLQLITWSGTALSLLVILGVATAPALLVLCVLWLSLVNGGGEFTGFQSDGMLVEVTFLSLFFAPWQWFEPPWKLPARLVEQEPPAPMSLWLLRFMVFRFMFASALVKLLSGDETWRNLTALDYHFETQPIPTPLAWYAHWLPARIHKAFVLGMYLSELIAPPLIFCGRYPRIVAGFFMFSLHLMIALTGNYTFLNHLSMLLCLPLLDDEIVSRVVPHRLVESIKAAQRVPAENAVRMRLFNPIAALLIFFAASSLVDSVSGGGLLPPPLRLALGAIAPFRIVDHYGLFAVMTTTRPEIVFEASRDGKHWAAYEFKYKVGDDLRRPPPIIAPHMPRLDWRLWFAAMQPVQENPWVLGVVRRLLEGSPEILEFFTNNPFPDKPPLFVRAFVYDYHFTTPEERKQTGCWWRRDNKRVYLPPVTLMDGQLVTAG